MILGHVSARFLLGCSAAAFAAKADLLGELSGAT
jgi:hypothetical protein